MNPKDNLKACKRPSFMAQKLAFYAVKGKLS